MKKTLVPIICLCLAAVTLIGCTPASSIIKDTTEAEETAIFANPGEDYQSEVRNYIIKSENYAFFLGEYIYYFQNILASFGEDKLKEFGYESGKPLKSQTVKGYDVTWFEFIDSMTRDKMKEILVACEYAMAEKKEYLTEAKSYIDLVKNEIKYVSDGDPDGYIKELYGNSVSYQSYLNALQMQYVYDLYYSDLYDSNMNSVTADELQKRADAAGNKDETPVRHVIYFSAESRTSAESFIEELKAGGAVTKEAVRELALMKGIYAVEDILTKDSAAVADIISWSFDESRAAGDCGVVKTEKEDSYQYIAVFYFSEGEATYLFKARMEIAAELTQKEIKDAVSSYSSFKTDEKLLDGINI